MEAFLSNKLHGYRIKSVFTLYLLPCTVQHFLYSIYSLSQLHGDTFNFRLATYLSASTTVFSGQDEDDNKPVTFVIERL